MYCEDNSFAIHLLLSSKNLIIRKSRLGKVIVIGDFVIIKYDEDYYPGKLTGLGEYAKLHTMVKSGPKHWKWPIREDYVDYTFDLVIKVINQPIIVSLCGTFSVPELDYLTLIRSIIPGLDFSKSYIFDCIISF